MVVNYHLSKAAAGTIMTGVRVPSPSEVRGCILFVVAIPQAIVALLFLSNKVHAGHAS